MSNVEALHKQITVLRGILLESEEAMQSLGRIQLTVEKDRYWFVKTVDKINKAIKQQKKLAQEYSNDKVKELGETQPDGRVGIDPKNEESMKAYQEAMSDYMDEPVTVEAKKITLTQLKDCMVTLTVNDQCCLMWLLDES